MNAVEIRDATGVDLAEIRAIFNHAIQHTTASFRIEPESEQALRAWIEARDAVLHPVLVAGPTGNVLGWASLSPHKATGGYRHTAEISIYLREDARGQRLGTRMLAELVSRGRAAGHHVLLGGCCTESAASIRLHEGQGFEKVAHFREVGFKFGRWLDVAYYELRL